MSRGRALLLAGTVVVACNPAGGCSRTHLPPQASPPQASPPQAGEPRNAAAGESAEGKEATGKEIQATEDNALLELLLESRKGGRTHVRYREPRLLEIDAYASWVRRALRGERTELEGFAQASPSPGLTALIELSKLRRGAGAVVLRTEGWVPLNVQAPHTFFDQHTLSIALSVFETTRARSLQINTVHRGNPGKTTEAELEDLARSGTSMADVAHVESSFFHAAHHEIVMSAPNALTVQFHGFRDGALPDADLVVSAANTRADARGFVRILRKDWPALRVLLNPVDTRKLGGTQNAQAKLSGDLGAPFLHLEMSKSLRERLVKEPGLMERLGEALKELVVQPPSTPGPSE